MVLSIPLLIVPSSVVSQVKLEGPKGETVFFLLGMLDESNGRAFVEDNDRVEHFYCNEHVAAFVFRAYLDRLAQEQNLDPVVETRWRECLVSFYSKDISSLINGFYSYEFPGGVSVRTDEGPKSTTQASLSSTQLDNRDRALKLAYLAGVCFRYGSDGKIRFVNSSQKRELVANLLREIGCEDTKTDSHQRILSQSDVSFTPTDELERVFKRMPDRETLEFADSLVGAASTEDIAIYREVIREAQAGSFDGCALPSAFEVRRFTFVPMSDRGTIPGTSKEQQEALDDYDRVCRTLRSVSDLAGDSVRVMNVTQQRAPQMLLGRIGFSRSRRTAALSVSYFVGLSPKDCHVIGVAFLTSQDGIWNVTGYSTP